MNKGNYRFLLAAAVIALTTVAFNTAAVAATAKPAPVTGAIFTTDQCSNFVDGNVYDTAFTTDPSYDCALGKGNYPTVPYLNGGPRPNAPCDAAGLPSDPTNGTDYYFQVTDPSGSTLLTTDAIGERKVHVFHGLITAYLGTTRTTGIGKCGNISVELFPFNETPNPGGEYKAWMTPVSSYNPVLNGNFGFANNQSKTDNFKVLPPPPSPDCDVTNPDLDCDKDTIPNGLDTCPLDPTNSCLQ